MRRPEWASPSDLPMGPQRQAGGVRRTCIGARHGQFRSIVPQPALDGGGSGWLRSCRLASIPEPMLHGPY